MKFIVSRTSGKRLNTDQPQPTTQYDAERPDRPSTWEIEIETLEELIAFVNRLDGTSVIIRPPFGVEGWQLKIYDDYRE